MKPLGVAVVGLGVGEQHARACLQHAGCELRWIYDIDPTAAIRAQAALGSPRIAASFEHVLDDPRVDVVSLASYDDAHFGQALASLEAGKHVFVEKPLCRSFDELRAVRRVREARGRHLASNLVLRSAPLYQWAREAIADGQFGDVYAFDGDYLYGRLEKITSGWRKDVDRYSVMQGGGIHLVDLMVWLTGQRPIVVSSIGSRIATRGTPFAYDDYVSSTFRAGSGLIGRITANFGCVHRHQHVVRVFGTRSTLISDDAGVRLHNTCDPSAAPTHLKLSPLPASKGDLLGHFLDGILEGRDPGPGAQLEFDVMTAVLAADQAMHAPAWHPITYS